MGPVLAPAVGAAVGCDVVAAVGWDVGANVGADVAAAGCAGAADDDTLAGKDHWGPDAADVQAPSMMAAAARATILRRFWLWGRTGDLTGR